MMSRQRVTAFAARSRASYRIVEADSAAGAREAIASNDPDVILLDLVMPDEDGLGFLRWLRENGDDTPVLIVSALDTAKTAVEALRSGATDYIVKGFDIEELRKRVANILISSSSLARKISGLRRELVAEGQFRAHARIVGGDAPRFRDGRASGSDGCDGVDSRRERNRQGPCSRRKFKPVRRGQESRSSPSIARRFRKL